MSGIWVFVAAGLSAATAVLVLLCARKFTQKRWRFLAFATAAVYAARVLLILDTGATTRGALLTLAWMMLVAGIAAADLSKRVRA